MALRNVLWADGATLAKDLNDTVYIVTGANSGVGLETARQLVKQGAHVVMACRRPDAGEEAGSSFTGLDGSYEIMRLDLADLQSVRDFAGEVLDRHDRLDGLVCNAGLVNLTNELARTKDGLELTAAVSYFGHFLLTELLLDLLKASAPSRIVMLSSVVHAGGPNNRPRVHLDDLNYESRKVKNRDIYAEVKVASVLYAMELADRLKGTGVTTYSVHPGWARSNFDSGGGLGVRVVLTLMRFTVYPFVTDSNEESAQTTLHCLLSDDAPDHSGAYFSQHSVLYRDKECRKGGWPLQSPNPNAHDMDTARKLVQASYKLVGLEQG